MTIIIIKIIIIINAKRGKEDAKEEVVKLWNKEEVVEQGINY